MTPEQLEEIPGVGPKTVEKISIAVNNYFASLDAVEAPAADEEAVEAPAESGVVVADEEAAAIAEEDALAAGGEEEVLAEEEQSGDVEGLSTEAEASSESVEELVEEGQYFEAEVVDGVENAPPADVAEVHTHERPVVEGENVPDEELPGENR
jgi:N utilization substance protein A